MVNKYENWLLSLPGVLRVLPWAPLAPLDPLEPPWPLNSPLWRHSIYAWAYPFAKFAFSNNCKRQWEQNSRKSSRTTTTTTTYWYFIDLWHLWNNLENHRLAAESSTNYTLRLIGKAPATFSFPLSAESKILCTLSCKSVLIARQRTFTRGLLVYFSCVKNKVNKFQDISRSHTLFYFTCYAGGVS